MRHSILVFAVAVGTFGCALDPHDAEQESPAAEQQAICGNPMGCDTWLNDCRAKGGHEETQPGGIRMCCREDKSGKECISDPTAWPTRKAPKIVPLPPVGAHT